MVSVWKGFARTLSAFALATCLAFPLPLSVAAQGMAYTGRVARTQVGAGGSAAAVGMGGGMGYKVDLPDLSLDVRSAKYVPAPKPSGNAAPVAVPVPALAPSVVVTGNTASVGVGGLQKADVDSGHDSGSKVLLAAAESLPEGDVRENLMAMAEVLSTSDDTLGGGLEKVYDNSKTGPMHQPQLPPELLTIEERATGGVIEHRPWFRGGKGSLHEKLMGMDRTAFNAYLRAMPARELVVYIDSLFKTTKTPYLDGFHSIPLNKFVRKLYFDGDQDTQTAVLDKLKTAADEERRSAQYGQAISAHGYFMYLWRAPWDLPTS